MAYQVPPLCRNLKSIFVVAYDVNHFTHRVANCAAAPPFGPIAEAKASEQTRHIASISHHLLYRRRVSQFLLVCGRVTGEPQRLFP